MIVILTVTKSEASRSTVFVAIGLTLLAIHWAIVPFSGSSVNPARSFGTALIGNRWTDFWIYIIAPPLGAILGWLIYTVVVKGKTDIGGDLRAVRTDMSRPGPDPGAPGGDSTAS
jgi:aquaporin Z